MLPTNIALISYTWFDTDQALSPANGQSLALSALLSDKRARFLAPVAVMACRVEGETLDVRARASRTHVLPKLC